MLTFFGLRLVVGLSVCAERTAILNAVTRGHMEFEGLVLANDVDDQYPMPTGNSRQFMCEFGDFPVYLLKPDLTYQQFTTFELYPHAQARLEPQTNFVNHGPTLGLPSNVLDWSVMEVSHWVEKVAELPEHKISFSTGGVDGAMLLQLQEDDLQVMIGVSHSLHRRRLMKAISKLRDKQERQERGEDTSEATHASAAHGTDQRLRAQAEADRFQLMAKLKVAFDQADRDSDGQLDGEEEVVLVLQLLGHNMELQNGQEKHPALFAWLEKNALNTVSFPDFALAYSDFISPTSFSSQVSTHFYMLSEAQLGNLKPATNLLP